MNVIEIQSEVGLRELQSDWDRLLAIASSNTIFLTWEWITAWWSAYGNPGDLRILTARDDSGSLVGIAPLRRANKRKYGQNFEVHSFIGDGSNDSEYLDCIISPGREQQVMAAFRRRWEDDLKRGVLLTLQELPENSTNLPWFRTFSEGDGLISSAMETPCATVRLPANWDAYLATLQPRFRTKVRSVLRDLENRQEVRFGFCETEAEVEKLLPVLYELHTQRWKKDGKPGVFGSSSKRNFYANLSPMLLQRGWLRLSWMEWNGRVLACQYGFAYGGTYFHLQEGYEPASEHRSVGIGLRAWSIREFLKEGLVEYDFLGGISRHKRDWGAEAKQSRHLQIGRSTYRNMLFCRGPEWEVRTRESLSKVIPERVLAARRARLLRQPEKAVGASPLGTIRQIAGSCYSHLNLPALTRPLREQYQLRVSSGRWPRFSVVRRQEPSARILYYHRVNDDNDPFFPAISTELFEQEMRFISRHYEVVPLSALFTHLENGSKRSVLAITFDDGYQDNFQNAFPILQRFGLPATIFLTTGSMDCRRPMWFEQLAGAVKRTTKTHIDLEIDIPRRFPLTNEAERLASNAGIFSLLRALPDKERSFWLDHILKQIGVCPDDERIDKMLTWDQARRMKGNGIEFGGHTVTHPFLSKLTADQAVWEVSECKRRIEEELQDKVDFFAYPNGRGEDFGEWNKEVLRTAGYQAAVTTLWGMNYASTDRMELRRGGPWESTWPQFACKLDWYQLVNQ